MRIPAPDGPRGKRGTQEGAQTSAKAIGALGRLARAVSRSTRRIVAGIMQSLLGSTLCAGRYTLGRQIGRGATANVYLATDRATSTDCAIKRISKESATPRNLARFHEEVRMVMGLDGPFIARFFDQFEDANYIFLVGDYAAGGDLGTAIRRGGAVGEVGARGIITELVTGLRHLHERHMLIHRDVKPENILLDGSGHVMISDFGLSKAMEALDSPIMRTACGSPAYASPEIIQHRPYCEKADVWSAGVILYVLLFGKLPFKGKSVPLILASIVNSEPQVEGVSDDCASLVRGMLVKDPAGRLRTSEVLAHPWIARAPARRASVNPPPGTWLVGPAGLCPLMPVDPDPGRMAMAWAGANGSNPTLLWNFNGCRVGSSGGLGGGIRAGRSRALRREIVRPRLAPMLLQPGFPLP